MGIPARTSVIIAAGAALAVAGGLIAFAAAGPSAGTATKADALSAARGGQGVHRAAPPLKIRSVTPADGSRGVTGTSPVTLTYNQPFPAGAPLPRLSPAVPGSWQRSGDSVTFTPATGFAGSTRVRVTVPGTGSRGRSENTTTFTTAKYSTLRLQQLLAQLGYLPMSWAADLGGTITPGDARAQAAAAYVPPSGSFTWDGGYPQRLHRYWKPGSPNLLTAGAVTGFQADHNLPPDGVAGASVWKALLAAAATGKRNTHGYSYAIASESSPESLTIWHNGKKVLSALANTGISSAPTSIGTFPVYEKLQFQIMKGTNPDGSHYADPVKWVSYFTGGQAVHYFPRGSFGWPQSLGCIELSYRDAERSYWALPYGSLVTVTG